MKFYIALLLLFCATTAFSQSTTKDKDAKNKELWESLNKPENYIIDQEDIYTPDQERFLDEIITDYRKRNGVEIVIIAVATAEKFDALTLHDSHRWANATAEDNGILLAISKSLHRMRIQNGNKVKEKISDAETRLIIDAFCIPKFKNNDYYQGTVDGIIEIVKKLK